MCVFSATFIYFLRPDNNMPGRDCAAPPPQAYVHAYRVIDREGEDYELREVGYFAVRTDPDRAVELLRERGWEVVKVSIPEWVEAVKKEALSSAEFIRLEEGDNLIGILVREQPDEEVREYQGQKRKQYLFKVKWLVLPNGDRVEFDEPKKLRASPKLAGEIANAVGKKLYELTGGSPDPTKIPDVVPVKIRREGSGPMTRYKVVMG